MRFRVGILLAALFCLPLLTGCTGQIPPSSVGVIFDGRSGISQSVLTSRVVWLGPYQDLIIYPTSIKNASFVRAKGEGDKKGADDGIYASTVEGAILPMDVTVSYYVKPENVLTAFRELGTADLDEIQKNNIRWATIYSVSVVSGRNSIFDLISKDRAKIGPEVKAVLSPILASWGITTEGVYIGEVYPSKDINDKIGESISVKSDLENARIAKKQAVVDAQTILTNSQKVAAQNQLLAKQGQKVLSLKKLEIRRKAIEKWNGGTPVVGDGTIPFTNIRLGN